MYTPGIETNIQLIANRHRIMKNYIRPQFEIFEIVAERGYGDSVGLPGFGTEQDELVY